MKKITIKLIMVTLGILCGMACDKQKNEVFINEKDLTTCAPNVVCEYWFTEQADLSTAPIALKTGAYRVFWAGTMQGSLTTRLWMKAPMSGNQFNLNEQDILNQKVIFSQICPNCNLIDFKAVGGYVKGINTTPDRRSDLAKWLLEAKIFLQAEGNPAVKDTLYVKQHFGTNFVYN